MLKAKGTSRTYVLITSINSMQNIDYTPPICVLMTATRTHPCMRVDLLHFVTVLHGYDKGCEIKEEMSLKIHALEVETRSVIWTYLY